VLYFEGLYRHFGNRREVAAYAGLAPTPLQLFLRRPGGCGRPPSTSAQ
jgi:transposase